MMRGRKMGFVLAVGGLGLAVARDRVAAGENMACAPGLYEGIAEQVEAVHQLSLQRREEIMTNMLAEDSLWPHGDWGDMMWSLVALSRNERVEEANARLFAFFNGNPLKDPGLHHADRMRVFAWFNRHTGQYPGRLTPETEDAIAEALWNWMRTRSRIEHAVVDADWLWITHGTENHDLQWKPPYYHLAHIYSHHPDYRERRLADGYTAAQHFAAWNEYWKAWLKERATRGLWIELGSDVYRKYAYPALLNLYDLSPDPEVRKRAGMLLDLAFIEEAQISFRNGVRAGGKSRVAKRANRQMRLCGFHGFGGFEGQKALFHGEGGGSSHSKVFETSQYQLPPEAIALHRRAFTGGFDPFVIANRVPGELAQPQNGNLQPGWYHLSQDSALINDTYRTPHYMLGSTLQNPANPYAAISHQNRWSGIIFSDADGKLSGVLPHPDHSRPTNTRTHDAYWNFQHERVMIVQRLKKASTAYIGRRGMMIHFSPELERVEREGWVFVTNRDGGYVGVRPASGGYRWNDADDWSDTMLISEDAYAPVLFHAGCPADGHASFEDFQQYVLGSQLQVEKHKVVYHPPAGAKIEFFTDDNLPRVDGNEIDLRPAPAYSSPFLRGTYGGDTVTASVGPYKTVYDFAANEIRRILAM